MRSVPVEQAQGMVLCHDITRIVPGEGKGPAFRKGHVIAPEDIPALLRLGKEHIYVWDLAEGLVHEDDAAARIAQAVAGPGTTLTQPCEGRINLLADRRGLLKINVEALFRLNSIEEVTIATIHGDAVVSPGQMLAGTRVVPLVVAGQRLEAVEAVTAETGPVVTVMPFRPLRVGVVTTGGEVYHGRIEDKFGPVLRRKFDDLGCAVFRQVIVPDDRDMTVRAIRQLLAEGAEMIAVTGGMSVDPDDLSPSSIRAAGGEVVTYGSPTFPGAMFMLAYIGDVPVVGLPGCVMYHKASIFDLTVPRLVAGEKLTRSDIVSLGHGGLCAMCPECRYPLCGFGKN
ncbi:molybdopterin-binding protein [Solidesulfovibrio sp.]|uniref:molybdopterin-binding protein n=1 Tax=Solidesulfovibrio sp. TaxID=2910990 RepID=UPI00261B39E4|nr:molybdopterin-binding protein [Solidesulfovibrio sp.]